MKYLNSNIKLKSLNDDGEIWGYASVFNVKDGYNDVVVKGAFSKAIEDFRAGKSPKLLWQHDANSPIGVIEDMFENEHGLFIKCRLLMDVEKAREAYSLLKSQAINGFSIGYKINDSYFQGNVRFLKDIELLEVSVVTFPACKEATVDYVKQQNISDLSTDFSSCLELLKELSDKLKNLSGNTSMQNKPTN